MKSIPGAFVLGMLIIGMFADHLPIYRQSAISKPLGESSASTHLFRTAQLENTSPGVL